MAAGQERQEPETFAQEVQEGKLDIAPELNREALESIGQLNSQLAELITEIYKPLKFPAFTESIRDMQKPAREMLNTVNSFADGNIKDINKFTHSKQWEDLQEAAAHLSEALEQKQKEWEIIEPFLLEEIKKPEYEGKSIGELEFMSMCENGDIVKGSLWDKALTAAIAAMEEQADQVERQLPSSFARKNITAIKRATDRGSSLFLFDAFQLEKDGQMHFTEVRTGKDTVDPISVYYCIDYNNSSAEPLGYVAKHLLEVAYSTAQTQGGFVAWQDIFENLGKSGRITKDTRNEWKKLFLTMRHADIIINNANEIKDPNCRYEYIEINEPFFLSYPIKGKRKGQVIDGICINPHYKPPIFRFAEKHGRQITRVPIGVYQVPGLQLTEDNARLHDYLISKVAAMIKREIVNRITYSTIFEAIHIDGQSERERKARERAKPKIIRIFEAFKKCNWIIDYKSTLSAKSDFCIDVILKEPEKIEKKGV